MDRDTRRKTPVYVVLALLAAGLPGSNALAASAQFALTREEPRGHEWAIPPAARKPDGSVHGFPLVLTDVQGGFAGFSGFVWTIDRDGSWRRQRYQNRPVGRADQRGMLSRRQVAVLSRVLGEQRFASLPETIGRAVGANPHIFTLSSGRKETTLTVSAGRPLPEYDPAAGRWDPQNRFVTVVRAIRDMVDDDR